MSSHLLLEVPHSVIISIGKKVHHPRICVLDMHLEVIHEHATISLRQSSVKQTKFVAVTETNAP